MADEILATAPDEEELKLRMELNRLAKEEYEMMVPPTHLLPAREHEQGWLTVALSCLLQLALESRSHRGTPARSFSPGLASPDRSPSPRKAPPQP